ncbi:thiol:disulfide interchange protein DsbA/DsbL [Permianibacter aggregans]|uniref:Thiol:disulfide interchange protein n=1 Tax=Permianibacter aggregans TaxID=1510150 RepID=A0A4R6ULN3_9GAMM|nr:thiol:disulfide interchange protein DsbA/DsbL [Permianibacter aggregans]QGX39901.1 thiol:disulfide interchange protein DsbA/DsbL [Permianibacter aggregans]TDQ46293.1 thiol:disulfide interchange protein DsbA [Permianibacter aggregans]
MNWLSRVLLLGVAAMLSVSGCEAASNAPYKEGVHYKIAKPAGKTDKPQVIEFFNHGCPHCYHAEVTVAAFHQQHQEIDFKRIAVYEFQPAWNNLSKAYYTAEVLGIANKAHPALFTLVHEKHQLLQNDQQIIDFLSQLGASPDSIKGTLNSFAVKTLLSTAQQKQREFRITSVPAFIVNDKYFTDVTMAGGIEELPKVLLFLTQK